ncbi:PRC and DUF2382 domain-containing protein [Corynebacterium sp. HMSC04H06]|uniref:PRC and DUF2382 domain-containing protein n=1 Tax=Corynebacterium sp. HMSC04H06 TaxID=1581050 RepID=UPI0008A4AFA7|nr:PRC and DUF2382 domain-containing protein [Corynebacterium sp. HMSC04H06]OFS23527.1 photosystem reaction center subunit H [Corynebacterium sp. HMSC04H06]
MSKDIKDLLNATAYDKDGEKLGDVNEIFVDDNTGKPTFVDVKHGLFGMNSSLVPLRGHDFNGDELRLAFSKDRIKDAPDFDSDSALTPEQQNDIFRHYGLEQAEDRTEYRDANRDVNREQGRTDAGTAGVAGAGAGAGVAGAGVAGERTAADEKKVAGEHAADKNVADREAATADRQAAANDRTAATNDGSMIRSEEQLNVNKENVATGEARLRKYVVTDTETVEVPVTHEEVRVERTPISEEEAANFTGEIKDGDTDEASVTLHEERVDVNKETVPVEKINLNKEQVTETQRHTEELRKEQIDTDGIGTQDKK